MILRCVLVLLLLLPISGQARAGSDLIWQTAVVSTLGVTLATNPMGATGAGIEQAQGEEVSATRIYWRWHWQDHQLSQSTRLTLFGQMAVEYWDGKRLNGVQDRNNLLVLTPVFRVDWPEYRWAPYLETSIGATLMSKKRFPATGHEFGQHYQFEDTLTLGWVLGEQKQWDLALRYRHYSNNGMSELNNGIDFQSLSVSYYY